MLRVSGRAGRGRALDMACAAACMSSSRARACATACRRASPARSASSSAATAPRAPSSCACASTGARALGQAKQGRSVWRGALLATLAR